MYTNNADKKNKNYRLLKNLILKNRRDLKMIFLLKLQDTVLQRTIANKKIWNSVRLKILLGSQIVKLIFLVSLQIFFKTN